MTKTMDWKKANPEKAREYSDKRRNTLNGYIDKILWRLRKTNPNTDIDRKFLKDLILKNDERCIITGVKFDYSNQFNSYHNPLAPSLDRIDSTKSYYKDNVQFMLVSVNRMKGDLPDEDFKQLLKVLFKWESL